MPEGPECTVVADAINIHCPAHFDTVEVVENVPGKKHRYSKKAPDNWNKLKQSWTLHYVRNKGKLILFDIELDGSKKKWVGLSTLGMSGDWVWGGKSAKHCRLNFIGSDTDLSFVDMRCFGTFRLMRPKDAKIAISKIGWDLVKKPMPSAKWSQLQRHRKLKNKPIGIALLDQSLYSGIGNIYKAEALFQAKIHPNCLVKDVTRSKWMALNSIAHRIMRTAYEYNGCSVVDFTANGEEGKAQNLLQVYGKSRCPQNHSISTIKQGKGSNNRTTWFCKKCLVS
jgi:formamidopyrimidine-DNA glycosylase